MLEVLNLTKVYKTRGGVDVRALDGVSLRFPERGMVFLLGKSGSGKSTLLNVCGGLDAPTSGEIVVKGRSSREFTQSDFDSYRNTFIGFIFQEYNILNEFSVEDNIALALELQGKPKDKTAVSALLEQVDLTGYAKRKPNTLSGGQKQRIAIARALIKSPEIIMADEPTGALDSNTGKQVFDTLKKLSRDKLVIVVSHDREFAEQYGDRVIELKDGRILSDVSKTLEEQTPLSENVTAIGETLCIKRGTALSDAEFDKIKAFLRGKDGDVVITGGEREVKAFREVTRITDEGGQEVFRSTDEGKLEKKSYTESDSRFIRSKLPLRHAARIGLAGLRTKPVRLAFTAILCTMAFILFGLLSTLTFYDSEETFRQTLTDSHYDLLMLQKKYKTHEKTYEYGELLREYDSLGNSTLMSAGEIAAIAQGFGASAFGALEVDITVSSQTNSPYWQTDIGYLAALSVEMPYLGTPVLGTYPKNDDEIMISSFLADAFINGKAFLANGDALSVSSRQELIGKSFALDLTYAMGDDDIYKVVGIFETSQVPATYESLLNTESNDMSLRSKFSEWLGDGTMQMVVVTEDVLQGASERYSDMMSSSNRLFDGTSLTVADTLQSDGSYAFSEDPYPNGAYASFDDRGTTSMTFISSGKTTLGTHEALIGSRTFFERAYHVFDKKSVAIELGSYDSYRHANAVDNARNTAGIVPPMDTLYTWLNAAEGGTFDAVPPGDALYTVYSELMTAYQGNPNFYHQFTLTERDVLINRITDALMDGSVEYTDAYYQADSYLNEWIGYAQNKEGMTPPTVDPALNGIYDDFCTLTEEGVDAVYNRPYAAPYVAKVEAVTGKWLDSSELVSAWEKDLDENEVPSFVYGNSDPLAAVYAAWRDEYEPYSTKLDQREGYRKLAEAAYALYLGEYYDSELMEYVILSDSKRATMISTLLPYCTEIDLTLTAKLFDNDTWAPYGETMTFTVVGFFDSDEYEIHAFLPDAEADAMWQDQMQKRSYVTISSTGYHPTDDAIFSTAFLAYDHSAPATDMLTSLYVNREVYDENDSTMVITSGLASTFGMVDSMVSQFKKIFLYVGIAMAAFAALLLSNFISVSISHKRREIGILRAVGARSLDVFKIFFSESFFITALCVVLSLAGSITICSVVNGIVNEMLGASLFVFGILSVIVLVAVALVTVVVATFLPVYNAAKRRPVESIRAL